MCPLVELAFIGHPMDKMSIKHDVNRYQLCLLDKMHIIDCIKLNETSKMIWSGKRSLLDGFSERKEKETLVLTDECFWMSLRQNKEANFNNEQNNEFLNT